MDVQDEHASGSAETGKVWRIINSSFPSNCYIGKTDTPGECIVIDPGLDGDRINCRLHRLQLTPRFIFCTHGHFDHCGSAAQLQQLYDTPVFMHAADEKTMKASNFMLMALGLTERMAMPRVQFIGDGFAMEIGQKLRYVAAPGHTPGSCLICWGRTIFSGDTIYAQGVGLSGLPGEDKEQLRHSILRCWDLFPLESTLCPGHGRSTTFAQMRAGNSELRTFLGLESASKGELLPCALPAVSP